jgi:large subunit ribosomal protein L22
MTGTKTNEVRPGETPGVRAQTSFIWVSAFKVREVLNLVRGKGVEEAASILSRCERGPAEAVGKVLGSAVANASNNSGFDPEELYVSACYADEGTTFKRHRPRARGRAGKIRKRTSHITVIVNRLPEDRLNRLRAKQATDLASRRRRVAGSRRRRGAEAEPTEGAEVTLEAIEETTVTPDTTSPDTAPEAETPEAETTEAETTETQAEEVPTDTSDTAENEQPGGGEGPAGPEEAGLGSPAGNDEETK